MHTQAPTPNATTDAVADVNVNKTGTYIYNGATWDRQRELGQGDGLGVQLAAQPSSIPAHTTAAANTAVVRTYNAVVGQAHRLTVCAVSWSAAAATVGLLTVQDGATTVLSLDVPLAVNTPHNVYLPPGGIIGTINTALTVTLAAGGALSVGKLNTAKITA
jgi:hypothetical protein